ncbi:MAG: hypothetical protein PUF03_08120 [Lachnospiraceae bacterium]|nr:hypothetical protein [Lachnospiraceae bacterium]
MRNLVVREKIDSLITREIWSAQLWPELEERFYVIVFGGAIRDILFGYEQNIRDIDVVLYPIQNCDNSIQEDLLRTIIESNCKDCYRRNQFDGYKIQNKSMTMDIWLLKDTWAFKQKILSASPQNLLKSVYLNIDAYAWNYNTGRFISHCDRIKREKIDIVLEESACEYLNLIRAVVFEKKYNMCLADRIIMKLREILKRWPKVEKDVFAIEEKHYGNIVVTKQDIRNAIERS